jgi:hypothetical protein
VVKVIEISLPEYRPNERPESTAIGQKLDQLLAENFYGKTVVVRCVGMRDHPKLTLDELVDLVIKNGVDKYDKERKGIADHMVPEKYRDRFIYGEEITVDKFKDSGMDLIIDDFHDGAIGDRGYSIRVDLIMIYDRDAFLRLENIYPETTESDVFVFRKPPETALRGLIKIT